MKTNLNPFVLFLTLAFSGQALAQFPNFPAADLVLGAPDFDTAGTEADTPSGIDNPSGIAIDPTTGKVFVSAGSQHRILRFASTSALTNGANAEAVLGQSNFSGSSSGTSATKFNGPTGLFADASGRLWVADLNNNRVVMFEGASTLSNGAPADRVFGQVGFVTAGSATSATGMNLPIGVFVDAADNLWVSDLLNHRILKFASVSTLANGAPASVVLAQPDFITGSSGVSATKINFPVGVFVDGGGRLWVADRNNARVLRFDNAAALATNAPADGVLGQTDFTSSSPGVSALKLSDPQASVVDASGTLFVLESGNDRIVSFKNAASVPNGAAADGVIGQPDFNSTGPGLSEKRLNNPSEGLSIDVTGALWVADQNNNRVLRFSPDRTPPTLTITSKIPRTTAKGRLTVSGTATDASGIASVRFRSGRGAFKAAIGTTSWRTKVSLKPGKNTLEFLATDVVGNLSASRRAKVTRN